VKSDIDDNSAVIEFCILQSIIDLNDCILRGCSAKNIAFRKKKGETVSQLQVPE